MSGKWLLLVPEDGKGTGLLALAYVCLLMTIFSAT